MPEDKPTPDSPTKIGRVSPLAAVAAELCFVQLPFLVIGIALFHKGELSKLPFIPEWALVSCVLIGQSVVKSIAGILRAPRNIRFHADNVTLVFALIIVLALVPSLLVLSLVLFAEPVSKGLAAAQLGFFALGLTLFSLVTAIVHPPVEADKTGP